MYDLAAEDDWTIGTRPVRRPAALRNSSSTRDVLVPVYHESP